MTHNPINHPSHYTSHPSGVECIQITEHMTFCAGNAVKYIWRAGLKNPENPVEDLKKAAWYIEREIARLSGAPQSFVLSETPTPDEMAHLKEAEVSALVKDAIALGVSWKGRNFEDIKRDVEVVKQREPEPIPEGIVWDRWRAGFFAELDHSHFVGKRFHNMWFPRRHEFPHIDTAPPIVRAE